MRRVNLLRSTPFRLGLVFAAMVVATFAVTGLAVGQFMRWELYQHQDQTISETYDVIANAYGDSDMTDLLETVDTNVRATRGLQRIFLVTGKDGRVLGGNIPAVDVPSGWSTIRGDRIGGEPDLKYRVHAGEVNGNRLVVGMSQDELDSLQEILTSSFVWATLAVALLAVGGGAWLGHRAQRRFDAVSDTIDAVSHGRLDARIPLIGRGDDIDVLSRSINEALARLQGTVDGMRQVSTDIAHDLKSPLNRMRMIVEEAFDKQQTGASVSQDLLDAIEEADRINETFEALLRISQIEAGSRRGKFASLRLDDLLRSLLEIYGDVAEDAGHSLALKVETGIDTTLMGDRELLTQMFANLIENAIRHTPDGTTISMRVAADEAAVTAAVEDAGPGIPEPERENVFRRLYRLDKSRSTPGSGLGLSLAKAVADLHGADIRLVDRMPGLGVELRFARIGQTI